jgi:copper chaperone CopZ
MKKRLNVEGMSCMHCVGRVKKYLETVGTDVTVDLESKEARFTVDGPLDMGTVISTINEFGFTATEK